MSRIADFLLFFVLAAVLGSFAVFLKQSIAEPGEKRIEVFARKFSYNPNIITLTRGDKVVIRLISEDVHHGLFIDGYNISTTAYPGNDGIISFHAAKTGTFIFRCAITCGELHPYMVGKIRVLPDMRFFLMLWLSLGTAMIILWKLRK